MAASVSQRWQDAARIGLGSLSSGGSGGLPPAPEAANPFLSLPPRDDNPFAARGGGSGGGSNPFLASGGGAGGPPDARSAISSSAGAFTRRLLQGGGGSGRGASEQAAAALGSLLEGASQVGGMLRRRGGLSHAFSEPPKAPMWRRSLWAPCLGGCRPHARSLGRSAPNKRSMRPGTGLSMQGLTG
jgi:hypothetical protein